MAPLASIPLPTGIIGIAFAGKDPVVTGVSPDSPLKGLVEPGYRFVSITMGNGVTYEGLSSKELAEYLGDKEEDHERVLKLEMLLPSELTLEGPGDFSGLIIEERDMKPTVVGIEAVSKGVGARIGMVVAAVELGDGCKIIGAEADEITDILANEEVRSIDLINPDMDMPRRMMRLPKYQMVDIPSGSTYDLGLEMQGAPAKVTRAGVGVREGLIVESLSLPEGHVFHKLNANQLTYLIDSTASSSGRKLSLVHEDLMKKTCTPQAEIALPLDEVGIALIGDPAKINAVRPSSVLADLGIEGATVKEIGFPEGPKFYELGAADLADIMQESEGIEGRKILLKLEKGGYSSTRVADSPKYNDAPSYDAPSYDSPKYSSPTDAFDEIDESDQPESISAVGAEDISPYSNEDGNLDIVLETGKLKVAFSGTPPELTRISTESQLYGKVHEGMKVHTLTLIGGAQYYDMTTIELTNALKSSENQEGRVLTFLASDGDVGSDSDGEKSYIDVPLPKGKLGISFRGKEAPAVVYKVQDESPLPQKIKDMCVDTLTADGVESTQMNAREVTDIIKKTTHMPGRVMRVRDPESENFKTISDEIEVTIGPGPVGVSFGGNPTTIRAFKEGSQLEGKVPPGYYLDAVMAADGYYQSGMTTKEVVGLLGFLNKQERTLIFKSNVMEPSPKTEKFPARIALELPAGKLGISFRGKRNARVSRLHEESKLKGKAYISMVVESIEIPGGSTFNNLTAAECAKILADTKNTKGRTLTLTAPSPDVISTTASSAGQSLRI